MKKLALSSVMGLIFASLVLPCSAAQAARTKQTIIKKPRLVAAVSEGTKATKPRPRLG